MHFCVWEPCLGEQGTTPPCHPTWTQTLLWQGRKDRVCAVLPFCHISLLRDLHQLLYQADKCSALCSSVPRTPQTPVTVTLTHHHSVKSSVRLPRYSQSLSSNPWLQITAISWPVDPSLLPRHWPTPMSLSSLTSGKQTSAQLKKHQISNVSTIFRLSRASRSSSFHSKKTLNLHPNNAIP